MNQFMGIQEGFSVEVTSGVENAPIVPLEITKGYVMKFARMKK